MKGPEQLPDEGQTIKTHVGTGLNNPTKVKAKVTYVDDENVQYEILSIVDDGDRDVTIGDTYGGDADGFFWEA